MKTAVWLEYPQSDKPDNSNINVSSVATRESAGYIILKQVTDYVAPICTVDAFLHLLPDDEMCMQTQAVDTVTQREMREEPLDLNDNFQPSVFEHLACVRPSNSQMRVCKSLWQLL